MLELALSTAITTTEEKIAITPRLESIKRCHVAANKAFTPTPGDSDSVREAPGSDRGVTARERDKTTTTANK